MKGGPRPQRLWSQVGRQTAKKYRKLVPGPYQLFLPNQTTITPFSFNMKSMSKEREKIESSSNFV